MELRSRRARVNFKRRCRNTANSLPFWLCHADMASVAAPMGQRGRPKSGCHADPSQRGKRQNTANSLCSWLCRLNVLIAETIRNETAFVSRSHQLQGPTPKHCKFIAFFALSSPLGRDDVTHWSGWQTPAPGWHCCHLQHSEVAILDAGWPSCHPGWPSSLPKMAKLPS